LGATGAPGSDSEHFQLLQGPAKPFGGTLMVWRSVGRTSGSRGSLKMHCIG
jgi:hypothetical protein